MDNFDNVLVIDADGHVYEGNVDLTSRMPEKWRSQAPVRLKDNEGNSRILLEGRLWSASQGLGPGVSGPMTDKARGFRAGMVDPHARLKDMDEEGIDAAILFGTQIALTVNGLMNKELAAVLCHATNEWLVEYCSADRKRLLAVGLIPCQDPPAAVKELEYLKKAGAITAMLPTNVYGLNNMGDSMFDPIYDCAQSLEMPLSVHPQTGHDGVLGVSGVMGAGSERLRKYAYVHMTAFPFELMPKEAWADHDLLRKSVCAFTLEWTPGSRLYYHGRAAHWVAAAMIEALTKSDYRDFIRENITEPLGLGSELFVGLPDAQHARAVDMHEPAADGSRVVKRAEENNAEFRRAGTPGGGGYATARAMAAFYQMMLAGGTLNGVRLLSPRTIEYVTRNFTGDRVDGYMGMPMHRGLGPHSRGLTDTIRGLGAIASPRTFGHGGVGSSYCWGDPDSGVSFAYLTNGRLPDPWHSARLDLISNTVHSAINKA